MCFKMWANRPSQAILRPTHDTSRLPPSASPLRVAVGLSRLAVQPLASSLLLGSLRLLRLLEARLDLANCSRHRTTNKRQRLLCFLPPRPPTLVPSLPAVSCGAFLTTAVAEIERCGEGRAALTGQRCNRYCSEGAVLTKAQPKCTLNK